MRILICILAAALLACEAEQPARTPASTSTPVATSPATATAPVAAASDPTQTFRRLVDAINRGDQTAAEAVMQPNATWERGGQCPPGQCSGIERVRTEIMRDIAAHHRIDVLSTEVSESTVTGKVELRTDQTRARGVERVIQIFTVEVNAGRITSVRVLNDLTDASTASFVGQRGGGGG